MIDEEQEQQGNWENEGGASAPEEQTTPKGLEISVPKRKDIVDALRKLVHPVKKS